jgi:hypothetical protein
MRKILLNRSFWVFGDDVMRALGTLEIYELRRNKKTDLIPNHPFPVYLWWDSDAVGLSEFAMCETLLEAVLEGQSFVQKRINPRRLSLLEYNKIKQHLYGPVRGKASR